MFHPTRSLALASALVLSLAAPALAQADEPTPAKKPSSAGASSPGGRNITAFDRHVQSGIGGYYDSEFKWPLGKLSTFDQHRLILQASSYLHDNLFFNAEIEFEHGGLINAGTNDGELKIEQAWAEYKVSDLLALRSGVVLIPFGIVNVLHDSDFREATTRPLMAQNIVPTTWMETGVGLRGVAYPTEQMQLTYEGYVTNGLNDRLSPVTGLKSAKGSLSNDNNGNKAVSGRLGLSPWLGLDIGLDGYHAAYDVTGTKKLTMLGADIDWTAGPFEVVGEYANVMTEGGTNTAASTAIPTGLSGYYVEGRYRFFPSFLDDTFLGKGGGFDRATFTLFGRYGAADTNSAAFDSSDKIEAVAGINYRPVPTFVTKLEYQRVMEPATGKNDDVVWSSVAVGF